MVESDIVLLYIWSYVWEIIYAVEPSVATVQTPRRPSLWRMAVEGPRHSHRQGVGALSMHVAPPAIQTVVVPTGVIVLLGTLQQVQFTSSTTVAQCKCPPIESHKCKCILHFRREDMQICISSLLTWFSQTHLSLKENACPVGDKILHDLRIHYSTYIHHFASLERHVCVGDSLRAS
jgi:hypothetical protein